MLEKREALEVLVRSCLSIDQIVDLINGESRCQFKAIEIASIYAFDCVDMEYYDTEMDIDENALDVGLFALNNSGAKYDYNEALEIAVSLRRE